MYWHQYECSVIPVVKGAWSAADWAVQKAVQKAARHVARQERVRVLVVLENG